MKKSKWSKVKSKYNPFTSPSENTNMHRIGMNSSERSSNEKEEPRNSRENGSCQQRQQQNKYQKKRSTSDKNIPIKKINNSLTKKKRHGRAMKHPKNLKRLRWECQRHIPFESERALLPLLLKYGTNERGMLNTKRESRIQSIEQSCIRHGMHINQACSLRRHHIKNLNQYQSFRELGLGDNKDIYNTAMKFEQAVRNYLMFHSNVHFLTENDQKKLRVGPTPDFLLSSPIIIYNQSNTHQSPIHWIEAKMFYGASTIERDEKSAVGKILTTAEKYVHRYGPGAIVFAFGCGATLARELMIRNVIALDATPLDLTIMVDEQRKWCADSKGRILI